ALPILPHPLGGLRNRLEAPLQRMRSRSARASEGDQGRRPAPLVPVLAAVGSALGRPARSVRALLTLPRRVPAGSAKAPPALIDSAPSPIDVIGLVERLA